MPAPILCAMAGRTRTPSADAPAPSGAGVAVWAALAGAALAAAVAFAHPGVSTGSDGPSLGLAIAALALGSSLIARVAKGGPERDALGWRLGAALLLLVCGWAVSAVASAQRWTSVFGAPTSGEGLIQLAALVGLAYAAAFSSRRLRPALVFAAPLVAALEVLLVAYQLAVAGHPQGSLANSTYMGQVLLLCLPLVVAPALSPGVPRRSAVWRLLLAAAVVACLAAAQSWAATVIALAWAAWVAIRRWEGPRAGAARAIAPAAAGAVVLAAAAAAAFAPGLAGVLDSRLGYWRAALRSIAGSPWLGWGPDTFRPVVARIAPPAMLEYGPQGSLLTGHAQLTVDPHAIVLSVVLAGGMLGLALAAWAAAEIVANWRWQRGADRAANPWAAAVVLYAASLLIAPAPLQTVVAAALVLGASLRPERSRAVPRAAGAALAGVTLLAGLLTAALALTGVALDTGPAPTPADASRALALSRLWATDPFLHYEASLVAGTATPDAPDAPDLAAIRRAVALAPDDPFYALELARTLASRGDADAPAAYRRAIALFPSSYEAHVAFARYLLAASDPAAALAEARTAIALAPRPPDAYEVAASASEALGRAGEAAAYRAAAVRAGASAGASVSP